MDFITPFSAVWNWVELFKLDDYPIGDPVEDFWCGFAREFYSWLNANILPPADNIYAINQTKVILLDKYLEWRQVVHKSHQDSITSRGHFCIYHVFMLACEQIKVAELRVQKPLFYPQQNESSSLMKKLSGGSFLFLDGLDE